MNAKDSPRWCAVCNEYGDHHTDRHPAHQEEREERPPTIRDEVLRVLGDDLWMTARMIANRTDHGGLDSITDQLSVLRRAGLVRSQGAACPQCEHVSMLHTLTDAGRAALQRKEPT